MSTTTMEHTESVDYKDRPKYFAVPDPDTGEMTYWVKDRRGTLKPWPQSPMPARYGPILYPKAGNGRQYSFPRVRAGPSGTPGRGGGATPSGAHGSAQTRRH